jgi:thiamine kinase-like enzyme
MDCQSLNLLRSTSDSTQPIRLIDYEYAGLNPRAVDLANTFCEFTDMNNLRADYERQYPDEETQNTLLRAYLSEIVRSTNNGDSTQPSWRRYCRRDDDDDGSLVVGGAFLEALRSEIGRYTVLSHVQWAIWSLVQHYRCRLLSIDFDYAAYASHRLTGYQHHRRRFFFS